MKQALTALLIAFCMNVSGQSKQVKVLLQQISALNTYGNYLKKGYQIAKKGLSTISDLKNGELNLHNAFYDALATVSPEVSDYGRVGEIIALQAAILDEKLQFETLLAEGQLVQQERDYMQKVFERLLTDCDAQLELLYQLLTDDEFEMDDGRRIARVDRIYTEMSDNYTFAKNFTAEAKMLSVTRGREERDINTVRALNGLNGTP